jgi:hypothetical protein
MPNVSLLLSSSSALNQARVEAVREFAAYLNIKYVPPCGTVNGYLDDSDEYIEQLKEQENG